MGPILQPITLLSILVHLSYEKREMQIWYSVHMLRLFKKYIRKCEKNWTKFRVYISTFYMTKFRGTSIFVVLWVKNKKYLVQTPILPSIFFA
jgi:hypothetical protein